MSRSVRKIVNIDESKCDGCGWCETACVEGALRVIDGKARLISENYCDGLGACLGGCPRGAITVEERLAEDFTGEAPQQPAVPEAHACGCPSAQVRQFERTPRSTSAGAVRPSALAHWPIQMALVPPGAPFLKDADLLLAADCTAFSLAGFHEALLEGRALIIACPKLDDYQFHLDKLTAILRHGGIRSLTVVHMEVPCCSGLMQMARQALEASQSDVPLRRIVIGTRGEILED